MTEELPPQLPPEEQLVPPDSPEAVFQTVGAVPPPLQPAEQRPSFEERDGRGLIARKIGAATLTIIAVAAAGRGGFSENASAAESKRPPGSLLQLPRVSDDMTVAEGKKALSREKIKFGGVRTVGKDQKLDPGEERVVVGWDKRSFKWINKNGKRVRIPVFNALKPGSKVPGKTIVWMRTKIQDKEAPPAVVPPQTPPPLVEQPPQSPPVVEQPPVNPEPETPPNPEQSPDKEAEKLMRENAVVINFMVNCSGYLIRDNTGKAIGAVSSEHCGLKEKVIETDSNGKPVFRFDEPLTVSKGDNFSAMTPVARANGVFIENRGQSSSSFDTAIVSFEGSDPEKVYAAYKANLITDAEAASLSRGTKVYNAGYPLLNLGSNPPTRSFQIMTGEFMNPARIETALGESLETQMVAFNPNENGYVCAPGNSGSLGFIMIPKSMPDGTTKLVPKYLGTDAAIHDLRPPETNLYTPSSRDYIGPTIRVQLEQQYSVDLSKYTNGVVCFFDHRLPAARDRLFVRLSTTNPGGDVRIASADQFRAQDAPGERVEALPRVLQTLD